jgi:hypothetical protein
MLNNWFTSAGSSKKDAVYNGASLRIEPKPVGWAKQPPLFSK